MRFDALTKTGLILLALLPLAGCKLFKGSTCNEPQAYEAAPSVPPLQVPAGLDAPATKGALKIPELATPEHKRTAGEPCLEEPPSYYPGKERPGAATLPPAPEAPVPTQ